jgi:anthranilate synthase/aminodeoxychorismate synthase-like glutamine amidotransferase
VKEPIERCAVVGVERQEADRFALARRPDSASPHPQAALFARETKLEWKRLVGRRRLAEDVAEEASLRDVHGAAQVWVPIEELVEEHVEREPLGESAFGHDRNGIGPRRRTRNFRETSLTGDASSDTVPAVRPRVLVIDNYDSFTHNLVQFLEELGATCDVRLNDRSDLTPHDLQRDMPHGVVISPGPGTPNDAGATLEVIRSVAGRVPLLGVCLGHQAIGQHFGALVRRAARPMHGKASAIAHDGAGVFRSLPSPFEAGRYHSLMVDEGTLPDCLAPTARTLDGELMGLRHRELPIEGVQFHPESILSEHGHRLLGNWLETL